MNRQAITQMAKDVLLEYKGDTGAESPHAWPLIVTQAANDVALRTGAYWGSTTRSVTAGVSDYPQQSVYAIRRVTCADGSGNTVLLLPITMDDLNRWGPVQGFTTATGAYAAGIPAQYIRLASNLIRLNPVPNYGAQNGLYIEGLAYPSNSWPDNIDECPLPVDAHIAVVYRAAVIRSAQFPDADNKARADQLSAVYETEIAAAKEMLGQTAAIQAEMDTNAGYLGAI